MWNAHVIRAYWWFHLVASWLTFRFCSFRGSTLMWSWATGTHLVKNRVLLVCSIVILCFVGCFGLWSRLVMLFWFGCQVCSIITLAPFLDGIHRCLFWLLMPYILLLIPQMLLYSYHYYSQVHLLQYCQVHILNLAGNFWRNEYFGVQISDWKAVNCQIGQLMSFVQSEEILGPIW